MKEKPGQVKVRLTITGVQTDEEGCSTKTAAEYEALYAGDDRGHSFFYKAEGEEAVLFLSVREVRMERGGKTGTRMVFAPEMDRTVGSYRTPFGSIPLKIRTDRVVLMDRGWKAGGSSLLQGRVTYVLEMEGDGPRECTVTIKAQQIN